MRLLLALVPLALALHVLRAGAAWQFAAAVAAILPLAAILGEATEHLSSRAGPGIGGLLNATFGNAAELIIALSLLFRGMDTAVKASLTGSVLGNLLLVLGASLLAGGQRFPVLRFNRTAAGIGATMMVLAATGMLIPAMFHDLPEIRTLRSQHNLFLEHELSLAVAVILLATYGMSLLFSLRTHKDLYNPARHGTEAGDLPPEAVWSLRRSVLALLVATFFIALVSEILSGAIAEAGEALGLSQLFLGVIVVAIVGNAAEHSTAIVMARKNQMDLAVGIAMGSALQIALFVAPVLIFASYLRAQPMDLLFTKMEVVAVILAVLIVRMVAEDGESNWLEGAMLLMIYAILAMVFLVLPVNVSDPGAGHRVGVPAPTIQVAVRRVADSSSSAM
jgi:Ca2+:H+ antiporter